MPVVHPLTEHDMSTRDATARLRYLRTVQERTRRATLAPSLALVVLGAVLLAHGLARTLWPHAAIVSIVLLAAIVAVRPLVRWLMIRSEERRGLRGSRRLRLICGAAGIAGVGLALVIGANPLISAAAIATAVAAYLGGLQGLAAAALFAGVAGDVLIARGAPLAVGELVLGTGFVSLGIYGQARESGAS